MKTKLNNLVDGYLGKQSTFCRLTQLNKTKWAVMHSDGCGTKSYVACLKYLRTGDASVFEGLVQDSINMNLDDLACVGAVKEKISLVTTLNRNTKNYGGDDILEAIIGGTQRYINNISEWVDILNCGGETADVNYLTDNLILDHSVYTTINTPDIIKNDIHTECVIVGLSSTGQANYENVSNSGMGSNGISAILDSGVNLQDKLSDGMTYEDAILSPTRLYYPVIQAILKEIPHKLILGMVHNTGEGLHKSSKFGRDVQIVKDNLFPTPPLFERFNDESVFNMGHLIELYVTESMVIKIMKISESFGIEARVIGYTIKN